MLVFIIFLVGIFVLSFLIFFLRSFAKNPVGVGLGVVWFLVNVVGIAMIVSTFIWFSQFGTVWVIAGVIVSVGIFWLSTKIDKRRKAIS